MSTTSQHPTVSVGASALFRSKVMPEPSVISMKYSTTTRGPEWNFDRVDSAEGTIYLPHGPVNPSGCPEDLPLTAADRFITDDLRKYIEEEQTRYSKNPIDWHLKDIKHQDIYVGENRGPISEGLTMEGRAYLSFEVPLAEGKCWRLRSQFRYLGNLAKEVLTRADDRSEGFFGPG